ncbi:MAG: HisA/HisF-related TIM barrel protein [Candidatus Omnitrophica bacterium]|nr:HisA/HisF-related TIM barrel protein [Candidatus Omnitrophota bacterium]MDD5355820.1 HisA/HisF-related TIM barrel protein [Candidatus Omnitrophota bacterium]
MKIIPAVDILGGKVVRLLKGSFQEKKEYSEDPVSMAKYWQEQGAEYLHIVDLDGARSGEPENQAVIKKIIESVKIPVEVGGGIRTIEDIDYYIKSGANRVVLGTAVINDLSFLDKEEIKSFVDNIAISCDDDKLKSFADSSGASSITSGTIAWHKEVKIPFNELINRMISAGIKYLNYTDRSKDGTLSGLSDNNIESIESILNFIGLNDIKIIYAGGIASLEDIKKLKNSRLEGVIVGKALYENKFTLAEAKNVS